jgi:chaperonin cofactor prefoldin
LAEGERRLVFDTGGKRKHVVRVVYAILALLMGASLFLVVGPFNIGNLLGTSDSTSASKVLDEQAERTERKLRLEPKSEDLLLSLTRTRIAAGNALTEVNPETGATQLTPEGRVELEQATQAWDLYLKQADEPKASAALLVAGAYFNLAESASSLPEALAKVEKAADAQQIAAGAQPTINSLTTLAIYRYYAGDFAAGDKAAKQAASKAPSKSEAKEVNKQMAEYRLRGKAFEKQKQEVAKQEQSQSKEALKNPLGGGLSGASGLGE